MCSEIKDVKASRKFTGVSNFCYFYIISDLMKTEAADYLQSNSSSFGHSVHLTATNLNHICRTNSYVIFFEYVYIFMFIFIYICFPDAVKIFQLEISNFSKLLLRFTVSSKLHPRLGISFQVTSKIHTFLARYLQE